MTPRLISRLPALRAWRGTRGLHTPGFELSLPAMPNEMPQFGDTSHIQRAFPCPDASSYDTVPTIVLVLVGEC